MIKEKKHRLNRLLYKGFVRASFTFCIENREKVFIDKNKDLIEKFVQILKEEADKEKVANWVYVFMPDHVHLILEGRDNSSDLWRLVKMFKQKTGWEFRKRNVNMKWQKDYYDHIHRQNEDLKIQTKYIAGNPVRKGMVNDWREYKYTGSVHFDLNGMIGSL